MGTISRGTLNQALTTLGLDPAHLKTVIINHGEVRAVVHTTTRDGVRLRDDNGRPVTHLVNLRITGPTPPPAPAPASPPAPPPPPGRGRTTTPDTAPPAAKTASREQPTS